MSEGTNRHQIWTTDAQWEALSAEARNRGKSIGALIGDFADGLRMTEPPDPGGASAGFPTEAAAALLAVRNDERFGVETSIEELRRRMVQNQMLLLHLFAEQIGEQRVKVLIAAANEDTFREMELKGPAAPS